MAPKRTLAECNAIMTQRGALHETVHQVVDGQMFRVYKNTPNSLREFWLESKKYADRTFIVYEQERVSYAQAHAESIKYAWVLINLGCKKGDRIGIAARNLPEWIYMFWAIQLVGGIGVCISEQVSDGEALSTIVDRPTDAWSPADVMAHCIKKCTCKVLVVDEERADRLKDHLPHLKSLALEHALLLRSQRQMQGIHSIMEAVAQAPRQSAPPEVQVGPEDNACIIFTSGTTTGMPKGVLSTNRSYVTNLVNVAAGGYRTALRKGLDIPKPDPNAKQKGVLCSVPLFHATGCNSLMGMMIQVGGKVCLMYKWSIERGVKLIRDEQLTLAGGVPSMTWEIINSELAKDGANSSIEAFLFGGGAPTQQLIATATQNFPATSVSQSYGMTESNGACTAFSGEDYLTRPKSCGLPCPVVDMKVLDMTTERECPAGVEGEIYIRAVNLFKAYWDEPEQTKKALTKDHWYRSGDIGKIDEEGFVYITDRAKDMIIRGGENIASLLVEAALYRDERVWDAAAVAVPDELLGELVAVVVTLRPEYQGRVSEQELQKTAAKYLAKHEVPVMILFQEERLARNASEKILKPPLRKLASEAWLARQNTAAKAKL